MTLNNSLLLAMFLSRVTFINPLERAMLVSRGYTISDFLKMSTSDVAYVLGRSVRSKRWEPQRIVRELDWHVQWINSGQGWACSIFDNTYPPQLRAIADPPLVLYGRGNVFALSEKNIAIVGTRNPSVTGLESARKMGLFFAQKKWNIVSGLAYGIDIASHKGVLKLHYKRASKNSDTKSTIGKPIVVLATGIDYIYPKSHAHYCKEILEYGGTIVSEMPPASQDIVRKHCFIGRNRIISGLSLHVIIVQCPAKSGAMATADFALEQGRNVWVHSCGLEDIFDGTRSLHACGAKLIDSHGQYGMGLSI